MSLIEKLILERCPEGVIFKALGDVCIVKTGPNINKQIIADNPGPYPVINSGREPLGYVDQFNTEHDPIGIASRGSVGLVTWTLGRFFRGNLNYSCTTKNPSQLDARFIYHYLLYADSEIQQLATHQGIPALNASALKTLQIPVPPKEVQAEVVRILDAFTELTAELTAELIARKKQYKYYRDQLLSFDDSDVEWKTLEEVTRSIASGRNKDRAPDGPIPVYGSTGLIGFASEAAYSGEVLLVARVGANAGRVNAVSGSFDVSDNTLIVRPKDEWNIRFAFHQLTQMNLNQYAVGGGQPLVTGGLLKGLKIPFPSMFEQQRIAGILDKFHALTTSLTEGLPHEIELRQKQYEYYRDLLLSFPKPEEMKA